MRMWMVPAKYLCREHLLGEHGELHKHLWCWVAKHRIDKRIAGNAIEPLTYASRHNELEREMRRRGYKANSPLEQPNFDYLPEDQRNVTVDIAQSLNMLIERCPRCAERIAQYRQKDTPMSLALIRPRAGLCAGAIAKMSGINYIKSIGYTQPVPRNLLRNGEEVYLLGVLFSKEEMEELTTRCKVTFIDHRVENIAQLQAMNLSNIKMRADPDIPMEIATWQHLLPDKPVPIAVQYVGDYMTWNLSEGVLYFNYGLMPMKQSMETWIDLLENSDAFDTVMAKGKAYYRYLHLLYEEYALRLIFDTTLEGIPALALNTRLPNSLVFDYAGQHDAKLAIQYQWQHQPSNDKISGSYSVTISTIGDDPEINCAHIAQKYGGDGNTQIANFRCDRLPFKVGVRPPRVTLANTLEGNTDYSSISPYADKMALKDLQILDPMIGTLRGRRMWAQLPLTINGIASVLLNDPSADWAVDKRYVNKARLQISWCWFNGVYRMHFKVLDPTIEDLTVWFLDTFDKGHITRIDEYTYVGFIDSKNLLSDLEIEDDIVY